MLERKMSKRQKMDGLQRLLDFLNFLRDEKIEFSIHNRSHDSISVDFAGVGIRYEVDFYCDEMNFSYFLGDEDVFRDDALLDKLIEENWTFRGKSKRPPSNA
jgi:hypothetical protein